MKKLLRGYCIKCVERFCYHIFWEKLIKYLLENSGNQQICILKFLLLKKDIWRIEDTHRKFTTTKLFGSLPCHDNGSFLMMHAERMEALSRCMLHDRLINIFSALPRSIKNMGGPPWSCMIMPAMSKLGKIITISSKCSWDPQIHFGFTKSRTNVKFGPDARFGSKTNSDLKFKFGPNFSSPVISLII